MELIKGLRKTGWFRQCHGVPEVLHEAVDVVRLGQGDLEAHRPGDVAGQASEALLARPADADEQGRSSRHFDEPVESEEVPQGVVEQNQLQLTREIETAGGGKVRQDGE